MKKIMIVAVLLVTQLVTAMTPYEVEMKSGIELMELQNYAEAREKFKQLVESEKSDWLPSYYVALTDVSQSFSEQNQSEYIKLLKDAQKFIDISNKLSPDNPEILVLQAMIHTCYVIKDGQKYGPLLYEKIYSLYQEAISLDPNNPRVILEKTEWDIGSAMYYGNDTSIYSKEVERAIELFSTFENDTPFYPKWGLDRAKYVLNSLNNN